MAEWGIWSDEYDDWVLAQLVNSYMRRKRFEARMFAVQLADPARQKTTQQQQSAPTGGHVSLDEMFDIMGADGFKGA